MVSITSAPPPSSPDLAATNLIRNLKERSYTTTKPYTTIDGNTRAAHHSCYKTTEAEMAALGHKFAMTVDLGESYTAHALLLVNDLRAEVSKDLDT